MLPKAPPLFKGRSRRGRGLDTPQSQYPSVSKLTAPLGKGSSYRGGIQGNSFVGQIRATSSSSPARGEVARRDGGEGDA